MPVVSWPAARWSSISEASVRSIGWGGEEVAFDLGRVCCRDAASWW